MTRHIRPLLLFATATAWAQPAPPPVAPSTVTQAPSAPARHVTVPVLLQTADGPIMLELDSEHAPITTANFLRYVDGHRFDGTSFYRAVRVGEGYGLVQGGLRNDPKLLLPPIAHEPTSQTGLSHVSGTISMARAAPGSATADFFIVVGDLPSLDADASKPDGEGFAAFGHVVSGMEVVTRIMAAPVSATTGPAVMRGQMLVAPVRIISVRRAPPPAGTKPAG